jgi:hypothetical protein
LWILNLIRCQQDIKRGSVHPQDLPIPVQDQPTASLLDKQTETIAPREPVIPVTLQNLKMPEPKQQDEKHN